MTFELHQTLLLATPACCSAAAAVDQLLPGTLLRVHDALAATVKRQQPEQTFPGGTNLLCFQHTLHHNSAVCVQLQAPVAAAICTAAQIARNTTHLLGLYSAKACSGGPQGGLVRTRQQLLVHLCLHLELDSTARDGCVTRLMGKTQLRVGSTNACLQAVPPA